MTSMAGRELSRGLGFSFLIGFAARAALVIHKDVVAWCRLARPQTEQDGSFGAGHCLAALARMSANAPASESTQFGILGSPLAA